jgi:hypothetical protein
MQEANAEEQERASMALRKTIVTATTPKPFSTSQRPAADKKPQQQRKKKLPYGYEVHLEAKGHTEDNCWRLHPEKRPMKRDNKGPQGNRDIISAADNLQLMSFGDNQFGEDDFAGAAFKGPVLAVNTSINKNTVILDSGCSYHTFNDKAWFNYLLETPRKPMMASNNEALEIEGIGNVSLITPHGTLELFNYNYSPSTAANMVSPGMLHSLGFYLNGKTDHLRNKASNDPIAAIS